MKLSELMGKEIVNIYDGVRLGTVGDSDLVVNGQTGEIDSIIVPNRGSIIGIFKDKGQLEIPWNSVKKIGDEVIIVELNKGLGRSKRLL
ncbi:MAG: hypothetical protein PWQ96_2059 [Clostridia bacterium]|jgi:YlmC/YmxH family sporulation protein|nr:hypothetical protein [Clostridia bacterium]